METSTPASRYCFWRKAEARIWACHPITAGDRSERKQSAQERNASWVTRRLSISLGLQRLPGSLTYHVGFSTVADPELEQRRHS